MAIITITSDYGLTDPYLPALKGALYSEAEGHQVVDISHALEPGNLMQAAFVLGSSYRQLSGGARCIWWPLGR
ncbi:MAG: SAM-dependent chlorinase/fluorinase [Owenweeksia sp.]|nr:SAM-dependent chlorinase/fluorinase [Owenweeksia sp.]